MPVCDPFIEGIAGNVTMMREAGWRRERRKWTGSTYPGSTKESIGRLVVKHALFPVTPLPFPYSPPLPSPLRWGSGAELYADIENVRTLAGADILDILSGEQPMQGACGLPFMFDLGDTHSHGASAEVTLNQVEDNRNKQRGQQVNGLAVLDAENGESGTDDEHTAYDAQFAAHGLGHGCTETEGDQVEHTLPAEEYRCGQ